MKLETASHQENSKTKCPKRSVLPPVLVERPRRKQSAALQQGKLLVSYTSWNSRVIPAWLYGRTVTHQWSTDSTWISTPARFQGLPLNGIQVWRSPLWMWLESIRCSSRGFAVLSKERHSAFKHEWNQISGKQKTDTVEVRKETTIHDTYTSNF